MHIYILYIHIHILNIIPLDNFKSTVDYPQMPHPSLPCPSKPRLMTLYTCTRQDVIIKWKSWIRHSVKNYPLLIGLYAILPLRLLWHSEALFLPLWQWHMTNEREIVGRIVVGK